MINVSFSAESHPDGILRRVPARGKPPGVLWKPFLCGFFSEKMLIYRLLNHLWETEDNG
jgi:hypothetical protein